MVLPSGKGVALVCVVSVSCLLATISYTIRCLNNLGQCRKGLLPWKHFLAIDLLVFAALVFANLNGAFQILSVVLGGVGHNYDEITLAELEWALKSLFIEEVSWSVSLCFLKLALIILYGRIFVRRRGDRKYARWIQIGAAIFVVLFLTASLLFYFRTCPPLRSTWTPTIKGHCGNQRAGWLATGITNLLTDVAIFGVPIVLLAELHMSRHDKITVGFQLFLGSAVCFFSLVRIITILRVDVTNITGTEIPVDALSILEPTLGIVFASVAGIVGREAVSNFVDRYIVSRSKPRSERGNNAGFHQLVIDSPSPKT